VATATGRVHPPVRDHGRRAATQSAARARQCSEL